MARVQESTESTVGGMETILQEYRERLNQALEIESNKLKEKAERDSNQIISSAEEEAQKTVAQAKQAARVESERIIAAAKEEAEQIARKSREKAAEVHQESARVINETREKASQLITEVLERGTKQAQSEFTRAASDARSKTSLLLTQVITSVEQIFSETEDSIQAELESLTALIAEAETKLQPLSGTPDKEAAVKSQQISGEAATPKVSEAEKTEPDVPPPGDTKDASIEEGDNTRLFRGTLEMEIVPPFNQEHTGGVPECLARFHGLKIISKNGYASGNKRKFKYTIDLENPLPLMKILKAIPSVKEVVENKETITVILK